METVTNMEPGTALIESPLTDALPDAMGVASLLPASMKRMKEAASILAAAGPLVPAHVRNPETALAIVYQAAQWGMSPLAVAQKSYVVRDSRSGTDRLGWEAQLVNALINRSGAIHDRLRYVHHGEGEKRWVEVRGRLRGEEDERVYTSPTFAQIKVRNSPLWFTDRDQQFCYYGARAWVRRYCPEVLLGVYTADEMQAGVLEVTDVGNPASDPYTDADAPHVESELVTDGDAKAPEPSGGHEAADDAAAGRGEKPEGLDDDIAWARDEVAVIKAFTEPDVIGDAWTALAADARFKRIVAYDQSVANSLKAEVAAHKKAHIFPGDRK